MRLKRLTTRHPELLDTTYVTEKVTEIDSFIVKGDTISVPVNVLLRHTVFKTGRLTLKSKGGMVSAEVPTDTFIQRDTITFTYPVIKYKECSGKVPSWLFILLGAITAGLLVFFIKRL